METIRIDGVEKKVSKTNVPFWAVKYNNGQSATIWDETIGGYISQKTGQDVSVEITSKGNYNNIRKCDFLGAPVEKVLTHAESLREGKTMEPIRDTHMPASMIKPASIRSVRDNIIIAQVILKEANNHINAHIVAGLELDKSKYGEWLCENVKELTGAYKVALDTLE